MLKYIRFARNIVYYFAIILLVIVCLATMASVFEVPGGYRFFMVESGSMEPYIKTGSIILIRGEKEYKVGDVIAFGANSSDPSKLSSSIITHRIFEFKNDPIKGKLIITKGDANQTPDSEPVKKEQILGKVIFKMPYLGYPVRFAKTQLGFITLIVIPGTLIIYSEFINIKNEISKLARKRREQIQMNKKEKDDQKNNSIKFPIVIFIVSFSFLTYVMPTLAYFNDLSTSKDNIIRVGTWDGEPPTPEYPDVVINEVYYYVDSAHGTDGGGSQSDEWVELYNNTNDAVNLKDWSLQDNGVSMDISHSNTYIPAKGFAVIAKNANTWSFWSIPSGAEKIVGVNIGDGLANTGDRVILKNDEGVEIDAVSWGSDTYAFNPSVSNVADGHSISRKEKGVDTDSAVDWMDTYLGSTPAGPNPGTNPHNEEGNLNTPIEDANLPFEEIITDEQNNNDNLQLIDNYTFLESEESPSPTPSPTDIVVLNEETYEYQTQEDYSLPTEQSTESPGANDTKLF